MRDIYEADLRPIDSSLLSGDMELSEITNNWEELEDIEELLIEDIEKELDFS